MPPPATPFSFGVSKFGLLGIPLRRALVDIVEGGWGFGRGTFALDKGVSGVNLVEIILSSCSRLFTWAMRVALSVKLTLHRVHFHLDCRDDELALERI